MKRILVVGGLVLLVLIVGVVYLFYSSLDSVVAAAIEYYGSQVTGTAVKVDSVSLSLSSGQGTIRGLTVANPAGFSSRDAFSLEEISVQLDPSALGGDPIVVGELLVSGPEVLYEVNESGKANLDVIKQRLQASGEPAAEPEEERPIRIRIRRFTFQNGTVTVDAPKMLGEEQQVPLGDVSQNDLGGTEGALPAELGDEIVTALAQATAKALVSGRLDQLLEKELGIKDAGDALKEIFQ